MALFRRNPDNTFRAKSVADLETVEAKLETAREALTAVESEIRLKSLEAALADDPELVMSPLRERLARARADLELLETAHEVAAQAERARLNAAADAAEKARQRTIRQHTASLVKAGGEMRRGLEQVLSAWAQMQRVVTKYEPLLRPDELKTMFGHTAVETALTTLVALEMFRQAPDVAGLPLEPKGRRGLAPLKPYGKSWGECDPIEDQIQRRFGIDAVLTGVPLPALVETIGAEQTPAANDDDGDDWHTAEMKRIAALAAANEAAAPSPEE